MTEDEELLEFQNKLWNLIRETSPPDESKAEHPEFLIGWLMSQVVHLINNQQDTDDE